MYKIGGGSGIETKKSIFVSYSVRFALSLAPPKIGGGFHITKIEQTWSKPAQTIATRTKIGWFFAWR